MPINEWPICPYCNTVQADAQEWNMLPALEEEVRKCNKCEKRYYVSMWIINVCWVTRKVDK